jgi:hypothetical protein
MRATGCNRLVTRIQWVGMQHRYVMRTIELLGSEVAPLVRKAFTARSFRSVPRFTDQDPAHPERISPAQDRGICLLTRCAADRGSPGWRGEWIEPEWVRP